jgi:hypothetical protein
LRSLGAEMERNMGDKWEEEDGEDAAETETVIAVEEAEGAAVRTRTRSGRSSRGRR